MHRRAFPLALALALASAAPAAHAQPCPPTTPLTAPVRTTVSSDPALFSLAPGGGHWGVVAVRGTDSKVWFVEAYDTTAAAPSCVAGHLADGDAGTISFLATDWRWRGAQTDQLHVNTNTGDGTSAYLENSFAASALAANSVFTPVTLAANAVAQAHETQMYATINYRIRVWPSAGAIGLKLYLFEPVTFGNGYARAADAVVSQVLLPGVENHVDFVAPFDGVYGIVITNEQGVTGSYSIAVAHCPFSFGSMTDNSPFLDAADDNYTVFHPTSPTWGVVGVRGLGANTFRIDIAPNLVSQYGALYACSDSVLASQTTGAGVRLVAGDFRTLAKRDYTAHFGYDQEPNPIASGILEWEDGADLLTVNAAPTAVTPPANNVFDAWSVNLAAGQPYQVHVTPVTGATASYRILLFRNPAPGTPYWATRANAVADAPHLVDYTPPVTGLYGIVVVNDNGGTGNYSVSVTGPAVGVTPSAASAVSRIVAVQPNPTFAGARIVYTLAGAGHARLAIADLLGRTVVTVGPPANASGTGELAWDGRTAAGARATPGVYFATLLVDGRVVDHASLVVLR